VNPGIVMIDSSCCFATLTSAQRETRRSSRAEADTAETESRRKRHEVTTRHQAFAALPRAASQLSARLQGSAGWVQRCNPVPAKPTQHRCNAPGMSEQGGLQKACCGLAPPVNPPANDTAPQ
jgi:hypothetical protein